MAIDNLHARCTEGWNKLKHDYEDYQKEGRKDLKVKEEEKKEEKKDKEKTEEEIEY